MEIHDDILDTIEMIKDENQVEYDPYYYYANTEDLLQKMILREQDYTWKSYNYARCKSYRQIHESIKDLNTNLVKPKYQRSIAIFNEFRNPFNF